MKKNLQKCRFCGTVHIWGKFRCPNYKKELDKTSSLNTPETITSASSRSDELSDNLESVKFPEVHADCKSDFKLMVSKSQLESDDRHELKTRNHRTNPEKSLSSENGHKIGALNNQESGKGGESGNKFRKHNEKKPRAENRKKPKRTKRNVEINHSDEGSSMYSNTMKLNIPNQRQECIEIMGWTTHPTFEKEYEENRTKIKMLNEKKCNIIT